MVDRLQKKDCCGCMACINICPLSCISLKIDQEGFGYPEIDRQVCSECGLCEKVCPGLETAECKKGVEPEVYGAWCKDEEIRFSSSSGGVFTILAEHIIEQGGVVFGAKIGDSGEIIHACTDTKEGVREFRKSKYVQSNIGFMYQEVRRYLDSGRIVLFSGTPCQILALNRFLGKQYDNLYTTDVICVGVSSPGVWNDYLRQLEEENGDKVSEVIFRHKETDEKILKSGQRNLTMKITFGNGKTLYQYHNENKFFDGFLNKLYLRPSCAECKAKNFKSGSDIQLGDFWEIERMYPEVLEISKDGRRIPFGISEVLLYTDKGKKLFYGTRERLHYFKADTKLVKTVQSDSNWHLLTASSQQHWNRASFFEEYHSHFADIYHLIEKNLNVLHLEHLSGLKIGMWGSYYLRHSLGIISDKVDCELVFQFRNSTICSIMSSPYPKIENLTPPENLFRMQMLEHDIRKEFRVNMEKYAESADFFIMDLLEERYENLVKGESVVTKSEGYFESVGIQGLPLDLSFEMWKVATDGFMELVMKYFTYSRIVVVEDYLCEKYGKWSAVTHEFENRAYIQQKNHDLRNKYTYIREKWPGIKWISEVPEDLNYTETDHRYGCIPEHKNPGACSVLAQRIAETIGKMRE